MEGGGRAAAPPHLVRCKCGDARIELLPVDECSSIIALARGVNCRVEGS